MPHADFQGIETLSFDVGGTLTAIDFPRIAREVREYDIECDATQLMRAEAATRPLLSARLAKEGEGFDTFQYMFQTMLEKVGGGEAAGIAARDLAPVMRIPGSADQLWCFVLPGVREALPRLQALGLKMFVLSNSDGSVERGLKELGLAEFFEAIFDSHVVGFSKPDPRLFAHALEHTDARAESTLHIGDMYEADVCGARAAGVRPLLLDPYADWDRPDCSTLPDLLALHAALS